jgi:hypothetical protein
MKYFSSPYLTFILWAHFFARLEQAKKPGFPLQVLGFAHANPVGFPLQSLARLRANCSLFLQGRSLAFRAA